MDLIIKTIIFFLLMPNLIFAEELVLKSGQKVEGKIIEQTGKYVKIDSGIGMAMTYYIDEIGSINGANPIPPKTLPSKIIVKGQSLLEFKLGVNEVDGHKVIFSFPKGQMFDALCMNCDTVHLWKNTSNKKEKLVVDFYDHNQVLIYADASDCAEVGGQFPRGFFAPINFIDINKDMAKDIAYFSVSTQACSDAGAVKLSGDKPPEAFINTLISAVKQGKDAFLALYSSKPTSDAAVQEQEQARGLLLYSLNSGAQFSGYTALDVHEAVKYGKICSDPLDLNFGTANNASDKNAAQDGLLLSKVSIPVGKCYGEWKILYAK